MSLLSNAITEPEVLNGSAAHAATQPWRTPQVVELVPNEAAQARKRDHGGRLPIGHRGLSELSRKAPHSIEVEQALLGAVLVNNNALSCVSDILSPSHFFVPIHQRIFETAAKLIASGGHVDPLTMRPFMENEEPISATQTVPQYLVSLFVNATSIANARSYAETIRDFDTRRQLVLIGEDVVNAAHAASPDFDPPAQIAEALRRFESLGGAAQTAKGQLLPVPLDALLKREFSPRTFIMNELLQQSGIAMVYAWRGLGKTWFALGLGYAAATGGRFLRWHADRPWSVTHVCGEMVATDLQDRLAKIAGPADGRPSLENYRILSSDLHERGLPDLASAEGQSAIERVLGDTQLLILDNVSTLFRAGVENEAESWLPVQNWLLKLRRQGRAVVIVHHAGKGAQQRGTSRREDILDLTLHLRAPEDYDPTEDARFEVHFEKGRGLTGKAKEPFEAKLETRDGKAAWTIRDLEDSRHAEIKELATEGQPIRNIAKALGMSKSAVQRALQKINGGKS